MDTIALDPLDLTQLEPLLVSALEEDLGGGDVTSAATVAAGTPARGALIAKSSGVVAGLGVFGRVFELCDDDARVQLLGSDGDAVQPGAILAIVEGDGRALLAGERTALNFVQRLCGIATLTRAYVVAAGGGARVLDTRKTTPGLRALEKYAVRCGGGENHRFGLYDEAMIKDNHVDLSGSDVGRLVAELRAVHGEGLRITAEARDADEALAAAAAGADVVLLDNLSAAELSELCPRVRAAAESAGHGVELEASGGVTLATMSAIAASGVDRVSVGALTHSAPGLDLSFAVEGIG
jgi:nicotinate-nucleotide pyrophosphorylase (carboxylating)